MNNLAVIIPTFNRKKHICNLLENLQDQKQLDFQMQIFVIVDGSTDGTIEEINHRFPTTIIIQGDGNWWWTKSINAGLKSALKKNFTCFLLMNDDTLIQDNFIKNYTDQYSSTNCDILGAICITNSTPHKIFFSGLKSVNFTIAKWQRYHKFMTPLNDSIKGVNQSVCIPGRGMLFEKSVLNKIGFFKEEIFPQYFADYDFSYQAYTCGLATKITWDFPIYSYIDLTGKGSKTNSNFWRFLLGFFNPMGTNSYKKIYKFYSLHGGKLYILGIGLHIMRLIAAYTVQKIKKSI